MNRTILITSVATTIACGSTFILRAKHNANLEAQLEEQRHLVRELETTAARVAPLSALRPRVDETAEAIAEVRAATTPEQRVERAYRQIDSLIAEVGEVNGSPDKLFRTLPDVLRLLKDLDLDEMIAVADKIDAPLALGRRAGGKGAIKLILLLLAGEQQPVRILDKIHAQGDGEAVAMALGSLATKDPQGAMRWINGSDLPESERSQIRNMIALKALNSDFDTGLAMLREQVSPESENAIALLSQLPLKRGTLDQAAAALRRPENAELQPALVNMVLHSTLFHTGIQGAREAVERYSLRKEEVAAFLEDAGLRYAQSDPASTIDWIVEIQPGEVQAESIPKIVGRWANSDYNAAGKFLGQMEPSPVRDLATVSFARTVVPLDPEAAAIWALEIQDAERRRETIEFVAGEWREKDQAAASAWLEKEGIELE